MNLINKLKASLGMKTKDYGVSIDNTISLDELPRAWPKVGDNFLCVTPTIYSISSVDMTMGTVKVIRKDDTDRVLDIPIDVFDDLFTPVNSKLNYPL